MKKTNLRKSNGITLIALVITIIVLLILAGVAIAMLSGENGILKKAAEAKEKTAEGKRDEATKMSQYEGILNNYAGKKWSLKSNESGELVGVTDGTTTIKLGATINYDPYTGVDKDYLKATTPKTRNGFKDQTFEINNNEEGKQKLTWKVLGVDDNGQIIIMPTENIKDKDGNTEKLYLGNSLWYEEDEEKYQANLDETINSSKLAIQYGVEEINKVCSLYGFGKGATSARSVTGDDINKLTGFKKEDFGKGSYVEYGIEVEYSMHDDGYVYSYIISKGASQKLSSGYNDKFMYFENNEWKELQKGEKVTMKNMQYYYSLTDYKNKLKNMYDVIVAKDETQNYYLGELDIGASYFMGLEYGLKEIMMTHLTRAVKLYSGADRGEEPSENGLRPAVSLKPDIKLTETAEGSGIYNIE